MRVYHNLTNEDARNWEMLQSVVDLEQNRHVDLCNAAEIVNIRKLGDIFAMTWRWVLHTIRYDHFKFNSNKISVEIYAYVSSCRCLIRWLIR